MVVDITDIEMVDGIIRPISGNDDDLYQDIWLWLLENQITDANEIVNIGKEIKRKKRNKGINDRIKQTSLEKPLNDDGFSILHTVASNNDLLQHDVRTNTTGKQYNRRKDHTFIKIDSDVISVLKTRYPDEPLTRSIRLILGLEVPKIYAWQDWELDILKEYYPIGGSLVCGILLERNKSAIITKANKMGLRFNGYNLNEQWFMTSDLVKLLGKCHSTILGLVYTGKLEKVVPNGDGFNCRETIITRDSVINYLQKYPCDYDHKCISDELKEYIPKEFDWISATEAKTKYNVSKEWILLHARLGDYEYTEGHHRNIFVRVSQLEAYLNNPPPRKYHSKKQPYKTVRYGDTLHYLYGYDDAEWPLLKCKPNSCVHPSTIEYGYGHYIPTCKVCLMALTKYRKEHKIL